MSDMAKAIDCGTKMTGKRVLPLKNWTWLLNTIAIAVGWFIFFTAWALFWCGSIEAGLAYLGGGRLLAESATKSFGTVFQGEDPILTLIVANHTDTPVNILGASGSCSCLLAQGLPATIDPGEKGRLKVKIRTSRKTGLIQENIRWHTNSRVRPEIVLIISGIVQQR